MTSPRLTELTTAGGCALKLPVHLLQAVLPSPLSAAPWADAVVTRVGLTSIAASVDFGTPIVDDATQWGAIAAAHALSDLYAVGARPSFALAVMGWPRSLPTAFATAALESAAAAFAVEEAILAGGHTIVADEPFLGFAVTGHAPEQPFTTAGARPGDVLVLTKPLGTGPLLAASRLGLASLSMIAVDQMTRTNAAASRVALRAGLTGATDVSGYGLVGAAYALADASQVHVTIEAAAVPLLPGALDAVAAGAVPPLAEETLLLWAEPAGVDLAAVDLGIRMILCAPETSGGLLLAVPAAEATEVSSSSNGVVIGTVHAGPLGVSAG